MGWKKDHDYFSMLVNGVSSACSAAELLNNNLQHFDPDKLPQHIDEIHEIEHTADLAKHDMLEKLLKEFITPIDREDILELADMIDDVIDSLEEVLLKIYMYNITSLREEAVQFSGIIVQCCSEMKTMMEEFSDFRRSKKIKGNIIEINRLEEEGDKLFTMAIRSLYTASNEGAEIMAWTSLYEQLECCCDLCEDVADVVERVILTNS